jgi:hypothetical protein
LIAIIQKMRGIEVVGLVLRVFPLVIDIYDKVYRPFIDKYKDYKPAVKKFQQGLFIQRTTFKVECRLLLQACVDLDLSRTCLMI